MKVGDLVMYRANPRYSTTPKVEEGMIGIIIHEWGDDVVVRWSNCEDLEEKRHLEVINSDHHKGDNEW